MHHELDQVVNATNVIWRGKVADATMKMKAKLLAERSFVGAIESIALTTFLQQGQVQLVMFTSEGVPRHFQITVGRMFDWSGWSRFTQRCAQRPAAQNIPLVDARPCLQTNELFLRLSRQREVLDGHFALRAFFLFNAGK